GDALAAADAGGGEAIAEIVAAKLVEQGDHKARAGGSERVAKSDRAAVDVGFIAIEAESFLDGEILGGEGFVDFDTIDLIDREASSFQRLLRCGHGADAHDAGIDAGGGPGNDAADGLEAAIFGEFFARDDDCGGTIDDAAGVSGSDDAVLLERRREL